MDEKREVVDTETGEIKTESAMAIRESAAPLSVAQVRGNIDLIQHLMREVMQGPSEGNPMGVHFGLVPGCGNKPTLLQPGSQKLMLAFRLVPQRQVTVTDLGNFHREVRVTTRLYSPDGTARGEGQGVCSTLESKYRYRDSALKCPKCGKESIRKGKDGGWYCWAKIGGCGAKFGDGDQTIEAQPRGKVEHPDPADYWNTVEKIACKRADVHATIGALAASDIFTQDIEDNPELYAKPGTPAQPPVGMPSEKVAPPPENPQPAQEAEHVPPEEAKAEKPEGAIIEDVKQKKGKKGDFWIATVNGKNYFIFDKGVAELAGRFALEKTPCIFTIETQGNYQHIETLEAAHG